MTDNTPLILMSPISARHSIDPNDIMVTKRSLQRFGHYEPWDGQLNENTDNELFDGIEIFQKERGLKVDGIIQPDGETALEFGRLLAPNTPKVGLSVAGADPKDEDYKKKCDHLYWNVDIPTCDAIFVRRGKRAAARCYHTATFRYAMCLKGTPFDQLPPLDTYN